MFAGFKISLSEDAFEEQNTYFIGKKIFDEYKNTSQSVLNAYVVKNGALSASRIEKDWFPSVDADIFLSHSHKDERLAIKFAGWLYDTFGVKTFIDSCVWGYADDLLSDINDEYSFLRKEANGTTTYQYNKCNNAASHVHMILHGALAKMIDNTECLLFMNTPNSISAKQSVEKTYSPWIYSELLLSSIVEHKKIQVYRKDVIAKSDLYHFNESRDLKIEYDAYTDHLKQLEIDDLNEWADRNGINKTPWKSMDNLYRTMGLINSPIYG